MRKCIILFLITGILWAQTDFDKLVLKDGTEYLGEYSRIEERVVYFKQKEGLAFQPVFMKLVSILELKDGRVLIDEGLLTKQTTLNSEQYEKLTNEEKEVFIEDFPEVKHDGKHNPFTHFPKPPPGVCKVCDQAKTQRAPCRQKTHGEPEPKP